MFEIAARSNDGNKGLVIQLYSCNNCGLAYHNPRMSRKSLDRYYSEGKYRSEKFGKDNVELKMSVTGMRRKVIVDFIGLSPKRILDYGCGRGYMAKELSEIAEEVIAFDLYKDPDAIYPITTNEDEITGKFDLIVSTHCLEHTYDPIETLGWMADKLADDGMLYMEIPTRRQLIVPHPFLFLPKTIAYMIDRVGLIGVVIEYRKDVAMVFAYKQTLLEKEYGRIANIRNKLAEISLASQMI